MFTTTYNKPFSKIFMVVSDFFYKKRGYNPYLLYFQCNNFDNNSKFSVYNEFMNSDIYTWSDKHRFQTAFRKAQKIYYAFTRFYRNIQMKKALVFDCNTDLTMEPLYKLKNKFKIDLIHENTLYKFSISDIMRISRCNLLNHSDLFIEPTMPKNPYNNVNFSRGNIYTIYLHLIMNGFTIPKIFDRFIHADVSLKRFHRENETFLLNKAISEYHMDMSEHQLYIEIIMMFRTLRPRNLYIHIDYPEGEVVKKCKHLLNDFWHSQYEMTFKQRTYYMGKLVRKIDEFMISDSSFGRIIIRKNKKNFEAPRNHYAILNLLSPSIPDCQYFTEITRFMETGRPPTPPTPLTPPTPPPREILIISDDDESQFSEMDIEEDEQYLESSDEDYNQITLLLED
jgi:hypothetical protein